jgi:hypothetical protein
VKLLRHILRAIVVQCVREDRRCRIEDDGSMKSLADMLGPVLKETGSAGALSPIWSRVVGELVARHTKPIRWDPGGRLVIRCDGEAWRQALQGEQQVLLQKISSILGRGSISSLVLEVE